VRICRRRWTALDAFITGPRKIALTATEMVTAILIPQAALDGRSHFIKLGARAYLVISVAMAAVRVHVENGVVTQAAVAVGSCGPVATRLAAVEAALIGKPLSSGAITDDAVRAALAPIDDIRADAAYRNISAAELVRRTVEALA